MRGGESEAKYDDRKKNMDFFHSATTPGSKDRKKKTTANQYLKGYFGTTVQENQAEGATNISVNGLDSMKSMAKPADCIANKSSTI
jgi:hypothetical protein